MVLLCVEPPKGAGPLTLSPPTHGAGGRGGSTFCPQAGGGLGVGWGGSAKDPCSGSEQSPAGRALPQELGEAGDCAAAWTRVSGPQGGTAALRTGNLRDPRGPPRRSRPARGNAPGKGYIYIALLPSLRFPKEKESQASCGLAIGGHWKGALRPGEKAALASGLPKTGCARGEDSQH